MKLDQIDIIEVWRALGGDEPHHDRAKAFWRNGNGPNVSLDDHKGAYFDFATGTGGGVLDLVMLAAGLNKREALRWLMDNVGLDGKTGRAARMSPSVANDQRDAAYFALTLEILADLALAELESDDPARFNLTELRRIARAKGADLMMEYHRWRNDNCELTAGMVHAGKKHQERIEKKLWSEIEQMGENPVK